MNSPITGHSTVADLVDYWLQQLRADGRLEGTTISEYERVLRTLVVPRLGGSRLHELTTDRIDAVLVDLGFQSVNRQRKAKVATEPCSTPRLTSGRCKRIRYAAA